MVLSSSEDKTKMETAKAGSSYIVKSTETIAEDSGRRSSWRRS